MFDGNFDEIIVKGPCHQRFEPPPHQDVGLEAIAARFPCEAEGMRRACADDVVDVGAENQILPRPWIAHLHLHREKRRIGNLHVHLFRGRDEVVLSVGILAQHAREQLDEGHAPDRAAGIEPGAVAADGHADVPAVGRVPFFDRRRPLAAVRFQEAFETLDAVAGDVRRHGTSGQQGKDGRWGAALSAGAGVRATFIIMARKL